MGYPPNDTEDNLFWYFSRLCFVNDEPTTLINTFVKKSLGDKLIQYDLENESFFALYERITKSPILYYENIITAVNISPRIAKLMRVEPNSAQLWQRGVGLHPEGYSDRSQLFDLPQ